MASAHVFLLVQQLVILSAPLPLITSFLVESLYFPLGQVTEVARHFAGSSSQQVLIGQEAASRLHSVALAEAFRFFPAPHTATAHVALAEQQAVMAAAPDPLTMSYLAGSLYFPLPQVTVAPRHFVVSFSQQGSQAEVLGVALVHFKVVSVALSFFPAMHVPAALQAPTDSTTTRATIFLVVMSAVPKKWS
jgi:hypothetical protein